MNLNEKEFKCSAILFVHNHTLHGTLHQAYVFLFERGMQSETGSCTRKKFQKDLQEERRHFK